MRVKMIMVGLALAIAVMAGGAEMEVKKFTATIDKDGIQRVEVQAGEYFYDPNYIVVKVNAPVEMRIKRAPGITPHDIVIDAPDAGLNIKEDIGTDLKVIKFTPTKPGKYPFYCSKKLLFFKSHRERGMEGILEVTE